jgi:WD40 repeat protein
MDGKYILTSSKGFNGIGCELRVWDIRKPNQAIVENSSSSLSSASSGNEYTSVDDFFQNIQPLQRFQYPGHTQDTTGCSFIRQPLVYQPKNDAPEETIVCFVSCSKDSTVKLWNQNNPNKCLCEYVQSDAGGFTALSVLENKDKPSVDEETKRVNNTTHHHHHPYPRIAVVSSQGGIFVYQIEYIHYQFQFKLMYRT